MSLSKEDEVTVSCRMVHHGTAASSSPHCLLWLSPSTSTTTKSDTSTTSSSLSSSSTTPSSSQLVYASHGIVNVCERKRVVLGRKGTNDDDDDESESVWTVTQTLRTTMEITTQEGDASRRIITSMAQIAIGDDVMNNNRNNNEHSSSTVLVVGFSNGCVTMWLPTTTTTNDEDDKNGGGGGGCRWTEQPIVTTDTGRYSSITDIDGHYFPNDKKFILFTCSSEGTQMIQVYFTSSLSFADCSVLQHQPVITCTNIASFTANVIKVQIMPPFNEILVLIGTAASRHNKIHLYIFHDNDKQDYSTTTTTTTTTTQGQQRQQLHHAGSLAGHEDWITCLAWNVPSSQQRQQQEERRRLLLASGSQDAKIRLWEFTTTKTTTTTTTIYGDGAEESHGKNNVTIVSDNENISESDDDLIDDDDDDENDDDDEGEARLELFHKGGGVTRVTLEALLFGHEEAVTAVCWHPRPMAVYRQEEILISSSMDRTILIWSPLTGVWTPLTRVGGAGGILGGSIGSTLLGFVDVAIEPDSGMSLVGHAYGGALHVWSMEQDDIAEEEGGLSVEEIAMHNIWKAMPCITGHFEGVTDLCWEAHRGDYLLTASADQTCRLWAPVRTKTSDRDVWVELARPQVHGYDIAAVTSVSTMEHRHLYVSGADEKEARVFDAPMSTLRLLHAVSGEESNIEDDVMRVDRAYIPSLGLSQKASAAEGAAMDVTEIDLDTSKGSPKLRLPLERDLGVVSLWPEIRKLFGHNTELYCLASTEAARSGPKFMSSPYAKDVLVASSTKARDVDAAAIRLWDAEEGKCVQVLSGGHRSTVAALCFSPDGRYLASSGKDRRLCLWSRTRDKEPTFELASAVDSAHKRIIWGLHFCPFMPSFLASGSRDGFAKLWKLQEESDSGSVELINVSSIVPSNRKGTKAESITSLEFAPTPQCGSNAILALGLECGFVELWAVPTTELHSSNCELLLCLPAALCHAASVTKLAWRPQPEHDDDGRARELTLASCGEDRGCRIFEFNRSVVNE